MTPKSPALVLKHKADFRARRKAGLQPVAKPWDWISAAEVQEIALLAYRAATHDLSDPDGWPHQVKEHFVQELASAFEVLVAGKAQELGIACAPAGARHHAECLREGLPASWRPQYPIYRPCSASKSGGAK